MKKKTFMLEMLMISILLLSTIYFADGQDERERHYYYPNLRPQHEFKPKINGWAQERFKENISRGLIAFPDEKGNVYIGWRLLDTDLPGTGFNVYRSVGSVSVKINDTPVIQTTDFLDTEPVQGKDCKYWIRPLTEGQELEPSEKVTIVPGGDNQSYYSSIKLQGDYMPQRIAVADLNGDGIYDFVIKQPGQGIDPAGRPDTTGLTYKIEAYLSDGSFLWRKDLGPGIEPGIWYSPMIAYDFDGDGKAEVAVKTGPKDVRESNGRVLKGPEWCSILDGMTGEELVRVDWPPRSPRYGDYNRNNRNQLGMAYLDGRTPCLLVARGTYKLMVVDAYQYHDGKLEQFWHWDGDEENPVIRSQGAHGMHSADIDNDGRDEIILGSVVLDDNGTALWSTGLGHPDKCYVTDIDPLRPGMEIFYALEPWHDNGNGVCMVDAGTGKIIWSIGQKTFHVGDGMVADIDPSLPGLECFATEDRKGGSTDRYLFSAGGKRVGNREDVPDCRNWIFWDEDLLRETITFQRRRSSPGESGPQDWRNFVPKMSVMKYKGDTLTTGLEGRVIMMADILGDWREELVTMLAGELRIYTTTIPASDKRICLMQDPVYRAEVIHRSMGYEQSPVTGYYLGVSQQDASGADAVIPEYEKGK